MISDRNMANPLAGAAVPTVAVTPPATLDALPRGVSEEAGHVVFLETTSHTWLGANFPSWRRKSVKFYYQLQADMPGKIDVPITLYSHLIAKMLDKGCAGCVHRVWIFEPRLAGGGGVHAPASDWHSANRRQCGVINLRPSRHGGTACSTPGPL